MWQYIVVYIIGAIVVFHLARKVYKALSGRNKKPGNNSPLCGGCKGCKGCGLINR